MLHLDKHIHCKKRHILRLNISFWRFDGRNLSVTFVCCACFKSEWSPLCCSGDFESTLRNSQWVKLQEKLISLCCCFHFIVCLFFFFCFFVTTPGRSSLNHQPLHIKRIHLSPFLIISSNTDQLQPAASKTNFIIISVSCPYSSTGPHLPLWCFIPTVIWLCSYLN